MSRFVQFAKAGDVNVLEFVEEKVPMPGPKEVRIRVKAIGLNRAEAMWRNDKYIEPVVFPASLGYEAAGVVDAVGSEVVDIKEGDEVNTIPSFSQNDYHTYGEVILAPSFAVVKQPKNLSFVEGASIWMMFVTAYGAFIEDAKIGKDDVVVIPAASSSVGIAAIQVANYAGATTIALTRTADKKQKLIDAGAKHVIVTDEQDFEKEILRITGGDGVRVVFDPVGGPNFEKLMKLLKFQGVGFIYGALSDEPTTLPVLDMIAKLTVAKAHNIWGTSGDDARRKAAIDYVVGGIESGALKPVVDRVFAFDDIREAHRYLEGNGQFGKVVVTV